MDDCKSRASCRMLAADESAKERSMIFPARRSVASALAVLLGLAGLYDARPAIGATVAASPAEAIARGRYLVKISHCNDCHTAGYSASKGGMPESRWLMGNPVGWRSRQGTTYAINLRLYMQGLSLQDWLHLARTQHARPPMPWWAVRDMNDADLAAMYTYVHSLEPKGSPAPDFLPGDRAPAPPFSTLPDMSLPEMGKKPAPQQSPLP
jgi:mono/diheme cytochrome c family protein